MTGNVLSRAAAQLRRGKESTVESPLRFGESVALSPSAVSGPKICVINDCSDQVNYGAAALVDGLLSAIATAAPTATVLPIPSHWLIDASFGFGAFADGGVGLRQPVARFPDVADQFDPVAAEWLAGRGGDTAPFVERMAAADLVILNGEGSIYRTNLSAIRELFLAWFAKTHLGVDTVFVNGMIHLTDVMPILPAMVRKTFASLDAVAVREEPSHRNLAAYVPGVAASVFPDSAFTITPQDSRDGATAQRIRAQIGDDPFFCFDPGPMPVDEDALRELIVRLQHQVPRAVLVSSAPADKYIEATARATGALYVGGLSDYKEWMHVVADAQFLVSGRYHNPILAAIMGCPSVTFASTNHKVHGACEMLDGIIGVPFDSTDLRVCTPAIEQLAANYVARRDEVRAELLDVCARRRSEVGGLSGVIASTLAGAAARKAGQHS
jgi:hypothetical protein